MRADVSGSMGRMLGALCAALVLSGTAAEASADRAIAAHLTWDAPEGCSSRAEIAKAVEARLDRSIFVPREQADVRITAELRQKEDGWRVRFTSRGPQGPQKFTRALRVQADECDAVDPPASLMLAMLVQSAFPELELHAGQAPGDAKTEDPWKWQTSAAAVTSLGVAPEAAFGLAVSAGFKAPHAPWPVVMQGVFVPEQSAAVQGGQLAIRWFAAGVLHCPKLWSDDRWRLSACGGIEAGVLQARGQNFTRNRRSTHRKVDARLEAGLGVHVLGPVWLDVQAALAVPILRYRFVARQAGGGRTTLHRTKPVQGLISLGLSFRATASSE